MDQDVDAFARAILRYLTMTGSWQAPRYQSGHMTFVDEKVLPGMASDLADFYANQP